MNFLRQGNLLSQIKNYFSFSTNQRIQEEEKNTKEPVKLDESSTSCSFEKDNSGTIYLI
jgi:hypothetical protein